MVFDNVGNPLPGANVFIQGTSYGSAADADGAFSFRRPRAWRRTNKYN
ncbi:MAG: carboxypeptidase-like regulatory domain-containing protein [bacterium]